MTIPPSSDQGPKLGLSPRPLWHLSLAIAVGLHIFWPVSLPYAVALPALPRYILGSLMIAGGGFLIAGAAHVFREARKHPKPSSPRHKLLVEGPYRYSRNPMYTGGAMTMIGISLLVSSLWFLVVPLTTLVLVKYLIILPEEAYLEFHFGNEYRRYKESVRRWL